MNTWLQYRLRISVATIFLGCCIAPVTAAEPEVERYAARVKLLVDGHDQLLKESKRILERKRELQSEYAEAEAAVQRLQFESQVNRMRLQGLETSDQQVARQRIQAWLDAPTNGYNFNEQSRQLDSWLSLTTSIDRWLKEVDLQSRRIDNAGRLVMGHMRACIEQAVALGREAKALQSHANKLQADYWALTDVSGQRSREELKAALRELDLVGEDNPAALMVRGVAKRRLGQFTSARGDFVRVFETGGTWQAVALAARGESLVAQDRSREGQAEIGRAVQIAGDDPRVVYFQAIALAEDGKCRNSETAWKRLLRLGGHDVSAHRGLALIYGASDPAHRRPAKALEHAELACELTGNSDWSCLVAFAAAKAANEKYAEASELAERAAKLTWDDKRELCLDLVPRYRENVLPLWKWK